jgi:hypothetical protein
MDTIASTTPLRTRTWTRSSLPRLYAQGQGHDRLYDASTHKDMDTTASTTPLRTRTRTRSPLRRLYAQGHGHDRLYDASTHKDMDTTASMTPLCTGQEAPESAGQHGSRSNRGTFPSARLCHDSRAIPCVQERTSSKKTHDGQLECSSKVEVHRKYTIGP